MIGSAKYKGEQRDFEGSLCFYFWGRKIRIKERGMSEKKCFLNFPKKFPVFRKEWQIILKKISKKLFCYQFLVDIPYVEVV